MSNDLPTLTEAARLLKSGTLTSRALLERCLSNLKDDSNARAAYTHLQDKDALLADADASDARHMRGAALSPFDGIPISIKDLFDTEGMVTRAGSALYANRSPAHSDAVAVARLRAAGFLFVGRTHMTEFAYSGLGLNPHMPQPVSVWRANERHVPGGSSSGAAISVATGTALAGVGTDTGGSCRIPAAFNGLAGFKPTASRIPAGGAIPLSRSIDSIGSIAKSLSCCAILDAIMSGTSILEEQAPRPARLLLPLNFTMDHAEAPVLERFETALDTLSAHGFDIVAAHLPALDRIARENIQGRMVAGEAWRYFADDVAHHAATFDPRVLERIELGQNIDDATLAALHDARSTFIHDIGEALSGYDAIVCPTTPILPPRIRDCDTPENYGRLNRLVLRNPSVANLFDGCSVTIPLRGDKGPVGLMLSAPGNADIDLLAIGRYAATVLHV